MKDFLGNEVKQGDYFAYPLIIGRSANMAIFQFDCVKDGKVKAKPMERAYGGDSTSNKFKVWERVFNDKGEYVSGAYRDMTPKERAHEEDKINRRRSTLQMFSERALLLPNFDVSTLESR